MKTTKNSTKNFKTHFINEFTTRLKMADDREFSVFFKNDIYLITIFIMQIALESSAHAFCKSKFDSSQNLKHKSSGTKQFRFTTLYGELHFNLPIVNSKMIKPKCLAKSRNACPRIKMICEMLYGLGLSTENTAKCIRRLTSSYISKVTVSNIIVDGLDKKVSKFMSRRINCENDKVFSISIDCTYFSVKNSLTPKLARYFSTGLYVVNSRRESGRKQILAVGIYRSETSAKWEEILQNLIARGMNEPIVITRDGSEASLKAIKAIFPNSKIQTCHFHVLAQIKKLAENKVISKDLSIAIDNVFLLADPSQIKIQLQELLNGPFNNYADAIKVIFEDEYIFTYLMFDKEMYQFIRTNNLVESINQNLKISTAQHKQYPNEASLLRAIISCINDINRNYDIEYMNKSRNKTLDKINIETNDFDNLKFTEELYEDLSSITSLLIRIDIFNGNKKRKTKWITRDKLIELAS